MSEGKRVLIIGGDENRTYTAAILRLLRAGYSVIAMSTYQPSACPEASPHADECAPLVHENLRWHCFDVADDRYRYAIDNALEGRPVDVLVYLADPAYFEAVKSTSRHLWALANLGDEELARMLDGIDALTATGG